MQLDSLAPLCRAVALHLRLVVPGIERGLPARDCSPHDHAGREGFVREDVSQGLWVPRVRLHVLVALGRVIQQMLGLPGQQLGVVEALCDLEGVEALGDEHPVRLAEDVALSLVGHGPSGLLVPFEPPAERGLAAGPEPRRALRPLAADGLLNDGVAVHLRKRGEHARHGAPSRRGGVDERLLHGRKRHVQLGEVIDDLCGDVDLAGEPREVERDEHVVLVTRCVAESFREPRPVLDRAGHPGILVDLAGELPPARLDQRLTHPPLVLQRRSFHLFLGRDAGQDRGALQRRASHRLAAHSRFSARLSALTPLRRLTFAPAGGSPRNARATSLCTARVLPPCGP